MPVTYTPSNRTNITYFDAGHCSRMVSWYSRHTITNKQPYYSLLQRSLSYPKFCITGIIRLPGNNQYPAIYKRPLFRVLLQFHLMQWCAILMVWDKPQMQNFQRLLCPCPLALPSYSIQSPHQTLIKLPKSHVCQLSLGEITTVSNIQVALHLNRAICVETSCASNRKCVNVLH